MSSKKYNAAIIGASGYTSSELIRLIHNHPNIVIKSLVGNTKVDNEVDEIYSYLKFKKLSKIIHLNDVNFEEIDIVFCCLPHGETKKIISRIPGNIKIIDLSSDYRISSEATYNKFYDSNFDKTYINESAYGLSEINKKKIKNARIIACPGCFPTSILLPLIPLVENNQIKKERIIIDAKTGISGAGRKAITKSLFCEINENFIPYNINKHRHLAEIFEQLNVSERNVQFTPQIIPVSRGIMSVIYAESDKTASDVRSFIKEYYKDEFFIKINKEGNIPVLRNVTATNFCEISIVESNITGQIIIFSVVDNLTKGSSGQAIQNFNLINDLNEDTGLNNISIYP